MKLKIGDSVKLKDGRKFKVVSKDNGYFVLKDSEGKMAKVKDRLRREDLSQEAQKVLDKLGDFAIKLSGFFDHDYRSYLDQLNQKYNIFEYEEIKEEYDTIIKDYYALHNKLTRISMMVPQAMDGLIGINSDTSKVQYNPSDMLNYLAIIGDDWTGTFEETVENVIKMLKDIDNTEEFLEMNGPNEEMNEAILTFIKEHPDFDWSNVQI